MYKNRLIDRKYPDIPRRLIITSSSITTSNFIVDFNDNKWENGIDGISKWSTSGTRGGTVKSNVKKSLLNTSEIETPEQIAADPLGPLYLALYLEPQLLGSILGGIAMAGGVGSGLIVGIVEVLQSGFLEIVAFLASGGTIQMLVAGLLAEGIMATVGSVIAAIALPIAIGVLVGFFIKGVTQGVQLNRIVSAWNRFVADANEAQNRVNTEGYYDDEGTWHWSWSGYTVDGYSVEITSSQTGTVHSDGWVVTRNMKKSTYYSDVNWEKPAVQQLDFKITNGKYTLIPS